MSGVDFEKAAGALSELRKGLFEAKPNPLSFLLTYKPDQKKEGVRAFKRALGGGIGDLLRANTVHSSPWETHKKAKWKAGDKQHGRAEFVDAAALSVAKKAKVNVRNLPVAAYWEAEFVKDGRQFVDFGYLTGGGKRVSLHRGGPVNSGHKVKAALDKWMQAFVKGLDKGKVVGEDSEE